MDKKNRNNKKSKNIWPFLDYGRVFRLARIEIDELAIHLELKLKV